MDYSINISFLLIILLHLASVTADDNNCDNNYGNFTARSSYGEKRDTILSALHTDPDAIQGFYSGSLGNGSDDTVYVLSYCRGDSTMKQCIHCLNATAVSLIQACPNQIKALSWGAADPPCTIRYSDQPMNGKLEMQPELLMTNVGNITMNQTQFDEVWLNLTQGLAEKAAKGTSKLKYASGESILPNLETIFALMQCSPDLSEAYCRTCLVGSINDYQGCCRGKRGGPVYRPSCIFRWDLYPFYTASTPTPPPPPSPSPTALPPPTNTTTEGDGHTGGDDTIRNIIIIVVVVVVVSVGLIMFIFVLVKKKRKMAKQKVEGEGGGGGGSEVISEISNEESLHFDLETVKAATDNFSDTNKLGRGGFGTVYKGKLPNRRLIAVKRLSMSSGQGEIEFKNEVTLLAKLQHRNLVRLLGFCLEGIERLLIYEYVPNSSLDHFIFDHVKRTLLNWKTRYKIITGIARGILYLHEDSRLRIIHRDLKASNILLDEDMNPKIADFGMAKLFSEDQTRADTNRVVGTYGYMAPEYIMQGHFSVKTDVFSFGILVLEIVSGRSIINSQNQEDSENIESLISSIWRNWREGTLSNIIDPSLSSGSTSEMTRCIHIGLLCVSQHVTNRPTMAAVVLMLNSHSLTLQVPLQPAFILDYNHMELDSSSSWQGHSQVSANNVNLSRNNTPDQVSNNDVTISELYPR